MTDKKSEKQQAEIADAELQKRQVEFGRSKGVAYPCIGIEDAISAIRQLKDKLGYGAYARADIANAWGHSSLSGPACRKISTCAQFGLLEHSGSAYSISQLARRILSPYDEVEKNEAIAEAVRRPQIYSKLITKYNGQAIPQMLSNILIREYNISEKAANLAVTNFRKSLTTAGILRNGVIASGADPAGGKTIPAPETCEPIGQPKTQGAVSCLGSQTDISITIPGTGIKVVFPEKYSFGLAVGAFSESLQNLKQNANELSLDGENVDE